MSLFLTSDKATTYLLQQRSVTDISLHFNVLDMTLSCIWWWGSSSFWVSSMGQIDLFEIIFKMIDLYSHIVSKNIDILNHHHVVPLARLSLTLSHHFSLSFIAFGRSSGLHPESSHSCCIYVWAGRPAFAWPYARIYRGTSLMSLSLLLQQCPACLVRLTCIVFVMGGKWPYSWCLVGCYCQDLFNIALNILVYLPYSFFFSRLVSVQIVHPYSSIDMTAAWKKPRFVYY